MYVRGLDFGEVGEGGDGFLEVGWSLRIGCEWRGGCGVEEEGLC